MLGRADGGDGGVKRRGAFADAVRYALFGAVGGGLLGIASAVMTPTYSTASVIVKFGSGPANIQRALLMNKVSNMAADQSLEKIAVKAGDRSVVRDPRQGGVSLLPDVQNPSILRVQVRRKDAQQALVDARLAANLVLQDYRNGMAGVISAARQRYKNASQEMAYVKTMMEDLRGKLTPKSEYKYYDTYAKLAQLSLNISEDKENIMFALSDMESYIISRSQLMPVPVFGTWWGRLLGGIIAGGFLGGVIGTVRRSEKDEDPLQAG